MDAGLQSGLKHSGLVGADSHGALTPPSPETTKPSGRNTLGFLLVVIASYPQAIKSYPQDNELNPDSIRLIPLKKRRVDEFYGQWVSTVYNTVFSLSALRRGLSE